MRSLDPIIESAIGTHSRVNRALVFLDRAAWLLSEAEKTIAAEPEIADDPFASIVRRQQGVSLGAVKVTVEILRGATAQAAHELAKYVCERG